MCQDNPNAKAPGLRLFDMESIIRRNKSGMVLLKKIDVGTQGFFEFSEYLIRIGFIKSLTHLAIVPILHRNMNKLMGMAGPEAYMTYKVVKDKLYALTQDGFLFSWSIISGKMLTKVELPPEYNFNDYEIVSQEKSGKILIRSKENVDGQSDADYFQPYQQEANLENQKVFLKQGFHTYKRWKWVEIVDENTARIIMEYTHPSYGY